MDEGAVAIAIEVPRDRDGTFEPQLIPKHARRFRGFDDKIIALYARGLTVREIQAFLADMYAVEVPPDLISAVTDAVIAEVTAWQVRPLEPMVHVVRRSLDFASWKDRKALAAGIRQIYTAPTADAAAAAWTPS